MKISVAMCTYNGETYIVEQLIKQNKLMKSSFVMIVLVIKQQH